VFMTRASASSHAAADRKRTASPAGAATPVRRLSAKKRGERRRPSPSSASRVERANSEPLRANHGVADSRSGNHPGRASHARSAAGSMARPAAVRMALRRSSAAVVVEPWWCIVRCLQRPAYASYAHAPSQVSEVASGVFARQSFSIPHDPHSTAARDAQRLPPSCIRARAAPPRVSSAAAGTASAARRMPASPAVITAYAAWRHRRLRRQVVLRRDGASPSIFLERGSSVVGCCRQCSECARPPWPTPARHVGNRGARQRFARSPHAHEQNARHSRVQGSI